MFKYVFNIVSVFNVCILCQQIDDYLCSIPSVLHQTLHLCVLYNSVFIIMGIDFLIKYRKTSHTMNVQYLIV